MGKKMKKKKKKWASAISNPRIENPISITKKAHWAKFFGSSLGQI